MAEQHASPLTALPSHYAIASILLIDAPTYLLAQISTKVMWCNSLCIIDRMELT